MCRWVLWRPETRRMACDTPTIVPSRDGLQSVPYAPLCQNNLLAVELQESLKLTESPASSRIAVAKACRF